MKAILSFPKRIASRFRREAYGFFDCAHASWRTTYLQASDVPPGTLAFLFGFIDPDYLSDPGNGFADQADNVRRQAEQALNHCFDLLGSGPVVVAHGMTCRGFGGAPYSMSADINRDRAGLWLKGRINRANLTEAQRIWNQVDEHYVPIDWQLDFKSGYRWRERTFSRSIRFGNVHGADIKVPWELARMQHLPTLAMACHYAHVGSTGFECSESYAREIRNQVLDFIATNPPGFGVNWACTMDVGIRLVNMLVSRDIAISAGMLFDEQFEVAFMGSVVAHAQHIASNLEWSPKFRGNHYLADIVALLFAAVYLPSGENVDVWLSLATEELLAEIACQFHEDGSNYEASLCYHRLSSEIVLWGLALLANLPNDKRSALEKPRCWKGRTPPPRGLGPVPLHFQAGADFTSPVPLWCWQRLAKMGEFTQALTRPDGLVVQFGDNDSGRFIVLGSGEQLRAGSDPRSPAWSLDHRSFVASVQALYRNDIDGKADVSEMGARILRSIAGFDSRQAATSEWLTADRDPKTVGNDRIWADIVRRFAVVSDQSQWTCEFTATSPGLLDGLWLRCFLGMGCYVLCGTHFYLAIRCGEIGLAGLGAHAHCDQLAIELVMNGKDRVRDPGSFIYTALPAVRNSYRSANAHHVPRVAGREPANLKRGVFDLRGTAEGECLYFGARGFIGRHAGYGDHVYRIVELADDRIVVRDFTEGSLVIADPSPASLPFSPGYGLVAV